MILDKKQGVEKPGAINIQEVWIGDSLEMRVSVKKGVDMPCGEFGFILD